MPSLSNADLFVREFERLPSSRRYVMGRGDYAQSLASAIRIAGFVDDASSERSFQGLPIVKSDELPADSMVVVASMLRPRTACERLRSLGISHLDYFAYELRSVLPLKPISHWDEFRDYFSAKGHKLRAIRDRFVDELSKETWDRIIEFRITRDLTFTDTFQLDFINQYFEEFLCLRPDGETFADIGAYDGLTSLQFAERCPGFNHIHLFEPSPFNQKVLISNLELLDKARFSVHPFGLGEVEEVLNFDGGRGSSSSISRDGPDSILIKPLDSLNIKELTFAKLDIEGHEIPALRGASQTLRVLRPRMAISAYHRATDFWDLPHLMDDLIGPCPLAMRHYSEGIDETVLFFLPENS